MDLDAEHRSLVIRIEAISAPELQTRETFRRARLFCAGTGHAKLRFLLIPFEEEMMGRGILLWLLGVPIPVIILLWLFFGR